MKLNQYIDHTILKANATESDVAQLCEEARQHEFFSVCINSAWVPTARKLLAGSPVKVCSVIGFPLGAMSTAAKVFEAKQAVADGADEIDGHGYMVKGGGAALTREKIVAALASRFVCIVDESKLVAALGRFPLPVEVIPMAAHHITRRFAALGGAARVRMKDGQPLLTDNGQQILDVTGLTIADPLAFESEVNQWPGVVTVGVFAHQKAAVCLLGTAQGVKTLEY